MSGKNIIIGIVAGIIAFAWGMASWMALPFHASSISKLNAQPVAVQAIKMAASDSGMYSYPAMDAPKEDMMKAPHILVSINYAEKTMPVCMGIGLLIQILGGLFLTCLVTKSKVEGLKERMMLIITTVLFVSIVGVLPNWHYWGFTPFYTFLAIADLIIAWGLAGFWISKRV